MEPVQTEKMPGPEVPPDFDMQPAEEKKEPIVGKVEDKNQSELKASITKKGQNSYYYAHNYDGQNFNSENAKKFYGNGLIYGGEPQLVEKKESAVTEKEEKQRVEAIKKYSWLDEDAKVKVYIDLQQFPTAITKDMVEVAFDEWRVDVTVVDADGTKHLLTLNKLTEKIEIDKSTWRFSEGKRISLTLKKWLETSWKTLIKAPPKTDNN